MLKNCTKNFKPKLSLYVQVHHQLILKFFRRVELPKNNIYVKPDQNIKLFRQYNKFTTSIIRRSASLPTSSCQRNYEFY